ncbi:LOW QUALITY PROTEIN: hypothetical protein QTO34_002020, partial [Cnephaeus nilssonii]
MGKGQSSMSTSTPLQGFLNNFQDFKRRRGDYGTSVNSLDLQRLCELEWPTFGFGWPSTWTYDLGTAYMVHHIIYGRPGQPDKSLQIWIDILTEKPQWLKNGQGQERKLGQRQIVLLAHSTKGDKKVDYKVLPNDPEDRVPDRLPPFYVPPLEPRSEVGSSASQEAPIPSQMPPSSVAPPLLEPTLSTGQTGGAPRNPTPATPPTLHSRSPPHILTRTPYGPPDQQPFIVFYTTGRTKTHRSPRIPKPTWDDCQQLLQTLFTSEERESEGKGGTRKSTNLSKVTETVQGPNESPTAFLERLCEAYRVYTPIDPDDPKNRRAINVAFVSQSAPDIRKKNYRKLVEVAQKVFNNREYQTANLNTRMVLSSLIAINEIANLGEKTVPRNALALPDLTKPFQLYVAESQGVAKGVLTQTLGPWKRPVAYLSKRLDPVTAGWPRCLKAIAAMAILVKEASKLTFGQDLQVVAPHAVETLLHSPPERWLSNARITQYKVLLLDPPRGAETPLHDCEETLTSLRADLTDQPISNPEETLFPDGSSFVEDGISYTRKSHMGTIPRTWDFSTEGRTHSPHPGLTVGKDKRINIYSDSRYAFATVHIHGALYQERGLLTSGGKDIKNAPEILNLLSAIWGPKEVAAIQFPCDEGEPICRQTAKEDCKKTSRAPRGAGSHTYSESEAQPQVHPRERGYSQEMPDLRTSEPRTSDNCPARNPVLSPGEHWEVDFTELPSGLGGYRYLLVFVDTFCGWPGAYPTRAETAQVVVKKLLSEILPRFGLPLFMGSDNGPAFIAKVTQSLVKALKVTWKLHCVYRPQSSGQVERMNQILKDTLTKLKLEPDENWVSLLPLALLRARCTPYVKGLTPFEIMFGRPPPLLPRLREEGLAVLSNRNLLKSLQALQSSTAAARRIIRAAHQEAHPPDLDSPPVCAPGNLVWVKRHEECRLWISWSSTPIAGYFTQGTPGSRGQSTVKRFKTQWRHGCAAAQKGLWGSELAFWRFGGGAAPGGGVWRQLGRRSTAVSRCPQRTRVSMKAEEAAAAPAFLGGRGPGTSELPATPGPDQQTDSLHVSAARVAPPSPNPKWKECNMSHRMMQKGPLLLGEQVMSIDCCLNCEARPVQRLEGRT